MSHLRVLDARRAPIVVFAAVATTACALVFVWGSGLWFSADEWDFLGLRTGGDFGDLFRPHAQHWSTVPILVYRLLWIVVGLRSYAPYLLIVLVLHVTLAALLRAVMVRAGAGPWIATVVAGVFVLFGAGYQNFTWAFQIGFIASIAFGVGQLLVADHDGPISRRDAAAVILGLLGVMCSGVAVTTTVVVGLAILLRRGIVAATVQVAPIAVAFIAWFIVIGHRSYSSVTLAPRQVVPYAFRVVRDTYEALGHVPVVGVLLCVTLLAGTAVARDRGRLVVPGAMLVGSFVFALLTATGRAAGFILEPGASRYLYVAAALTVPAIGVAADALIKRWALLVPAVVVVLIFGVWGNVVVLHDQLRAAQTRDRQTRHLVLAIAHLPQVRRLPQAEEPLPFFATELTIGWLAAFGRIGTHSGAETSTLGQATGHVGDPAPAGGDVTQPAAFVTGARSRDQTMTR